MSARETQAELDRLAAVLGKALDRTVTARLLPYAGDCLYAYANTRDHRIETAAQPTATAAVAELRAILRADTDGAVAEAYREGAEAMRAYVVAALDARERNARVRWAAEAVRALPRPTVTLVRTDEAIAAVLDELASLASEGPITAEMLRAMAAARRSR